MFSLSVNSLPRWKKEILGFIFGLRRDWNPSPSEEALARVNRVCTCVCVSQKAQLLCLFSSEQDPSCEAEAQAGGTLGKLGSCRASPGG